MVKKNYIVLKSVLIFIIGGVIWIFGVEHFILPDDDHQSSSLLHMLTIHLPDFLFIVFAAWIFYWMMSKNYQQLSEHEVQLLSRELEIETLYERERHLRLIMSMIRDINAYLITAKGIDELGKVCCKRLTRNSDYMLVWIGMIEEGRVVVKYYSTDLTGYFDFTSIPLSGEHSKTKCPIGLAVEEDQTIIINELNDPALPEKLRAAAKEGVCAFASLPLKSRIGEKIFGVMNIYSSDKDGFRIEEVAMLEELAGDIGFAIHAFEEEAEHKRLEAEKLLNYEQTIFSMVDLIESRDSYTAGHSQRVSYYCTIIAEAMGYGKGEIEKLKKAAMLHDIGKIQTPDTILLKPGKLDKDEHDLIKEHVLVGYAMLYKIDTYRELADIMRSHHERFDGSGYPDGLYGGEISHLSRIMIVADAFDAMTTSRIYKPRMLLEEALAELQRCSGSQFHPEVVKTALSIFPAVQLEKVHQLPTNRISNERLAYFYKDKLTGTFSYDYLNTILNNIEIFGKYRYLRGIFLKDFTQINKNFGWTYGDRLLEAFGSYLNNTFKEEMVFRRCGDDFLILSKTVFTCNQETMKQESPLAGTKVKIEMLIIDLEDEGIYAVDGIEATLSAYLSAPSNTSLS